MNGSSIEGYHEAILGSEVVGIFATSFKFLASMNMN